MKYIDMPLPETTREILARWFGDSKTCGIGWTEIDECGLGWHFFEIENQDHETIRFTTEALIREWMDVGFAIRAEFDGAFLWKLQASSIQHGVGNMYWNRCVCRVDQVLDMMSSELFVDWFDAEEWPSELGRALGR